MRVAAIDIGTNSVLLLVAEARAAVLTAVLERATITRLGEGVDRTRELGGEAVARTLACLEDYGRIVREQSVERLDVVGTSAMRDARGGEAFAARAGELLGVKPRVVSGNEEAELTFAGALSGLGAFEAVTVFDVGGGSTEIVARDASHSLTSASFDIGSVRLTERHVRHDPPTAAELEAVESDTRAAIANARIAAGAPLIGVAGTVTTLAAYALGVAPYDGARVHGARLSLSTLERAKGELAAMALAARKALPTIDPRRADVIVAGAAIVIEVARLARASEVVVSDRGVRWGLADRLARR